jgi:hypothetical protein
VANRIKCPIECPCLCHDTGGVHFGMHGDNGRCPTKDNKPVLTDAEMQWSVAFSIDRRSFRD